MRRQERLFFIPEEIPVPDVAGILFYSAHFDVIALSIHLDSIRCVVGFDHKVVD